MASKLEYLKKYLAKPGGEAAESRQNPQAAATYCPDAARHKEKKKRKKGAVAHNTNSIQIRDLSEALPKPREMAQPEYMGKQAKLLSLSLDEDEARLARDGELDYVDEDDVENAKKIDVETSGQKWRMQNHKKPSKQALRAPLTATKAEVVKEVKDEAASDSDMPEGDVTYARRPVRGRGEVSSPRAAAGDDDLSPPRAQAESKARSDLSPARRPAAAKTMSRRTPRKDSDDDFSPPRQGAASTGAQKRAGSDVDLSPPRAPAAVARPRHDSDADLSPPRGGKATSASQRLRHDSDADLSPPRKGSAANADAAAKRQRHDSDADLSPPRREKPAAEVKQEPDADLSPPRKSSAAAQNGTSQRQRHDSDADLSPPRKSSAAKTEAPRKQRHDSDADMSPPRKSSAAKTEAPRKHRHDSDADMSPPRKNDTAPKRSRHDSDADLSPPRGGGKARHDSDADLSPPRQAAKDGVDENGEERMSSGLKAGIISGKALKEQAAKVREDRKAALEAAPDHETGKGAETVYRSRQGGTINREQWIDEKTKKRKKKMSEYPEQELAWGGGLKQQSNADEEKEESLRVAAEPFARYEPGADATAAFQERQCKTIADPMANFTDEFAPAASASAAPEVKKPKCPYSWQNRFGIPPGYRWDGAVRGTNYEKRWLEAKNNRAFTKTERYKYERLED